VRDVLRRHYQLELESVPIDQPPNVALGEYALPLAFELAKKLRKPPRKIAEEIVAALQSAKIPGFEKFEVAGTGYINARVHRAEFAQAVATNSISGVPHSSPSTNLAVSTLEDAGEGWGIKPPAAKVLVEHTSINPNKAAHVGHLRNAILGDTFVRLLRASGAQVTVQNYIDNTGVQVADVVVGFVHLEKRSHDDIRKLIALPRFDYLCWDVYARASEWYGKDKANLQVRLDTLHAIEQGKNEMASIADLISTAVLRRHLETMQRLGIEYDFLPRESEILHLHFWDAAFTLLKARNVLKLETEGKNKGCWVMERNSAESAPEKKPGEPTASAGSREQAARAQQPQALRSPHIEDENQKVIVRSSGTVTYVGKDIAYHLWKFGLLGRDFGYRHFYKYPNGHQCWISTEHGEQNHPDFAGVGANYNVVDARQADPQNNVIEAIRALGYAEQAAHYTHFSYEMVALTPRCAAELGYVLSPEEEQKPYIEVSGRKGFGVKADDLIDKLIAAALQEVDSRHPDVAADERRAIASQIAVGALRYFMLKYTKNSVIAFDFKDALSFEGETGPYAQYAVVRALNIFRKAGLFVPSGEKLVAHSGQAPAFEQFFEGADGNEFWELWFAASKLDSIVELCIATTEPAYAAKYVFQLAQLFNNFYHRHHILTEPDEAKKQFLLATVAVVTHSLAQALDMMGITVPRVM